MASTRKLLTLLLLAPLAAWGCKRESVIADAAATPTPTLGATNAQPPAPGGLALPGDMPTGAPGQTPTAQGPPFDVARLPTVVARLDGAEIRREELLARAAGMREQIERMGGPEPPRTEEFFRAMLDQLIGSRLLMAEAKTKGYVPPAAEVAKRVAEIKQGFPDEATFRKQLAARGFTERQLAADLSQNMAIQNLVASEVRPEVQVTDEAARRFYEQNTERMKRPAQTRVRHLLVAVRPAATPEQKQEARKKADDLLARIRQGEDFAALAREHSDDPASKAQGGLLPWLGPGQTVPPFDRAAFALEPGKVSDVVETPFGFHVLRVEERRPAAAVPFEEAKPEILDALARRQARQMLERKVANLRKQAKVDILF